MNLFVTDCGHTFVLRIYLLQIEDIHLFWEFFKMFSFPDTQHRQPFPFCSDSSCTREKWNTSRVSLLTIIAESSGGLCFASPFTNTRACVRVFGN